MAITVTTKQQQILNAISMGDELELGDRTGSKLWHVYDHRTHGLRAAAQQYEVIPAVTMDALIGKKLIQFNSDTNLWRLTALGMEHLE